MATKTSSGEKFTTTEPANSQTAREELAQAQQRLEWLQNEMKMFQSCGCVILTEPSNYQRE